MMRIIGYYGTEQLAAFVDNEIDVEKYISIQQNVIVLKDDILCVLSGDSRVSYHIAEWDDSLENGDVVTILKTGYINKLFSFNSDSQTIVTTNKCNSNCIMCPYGEYVRKKASIPNDKHLLELVRYLPTYTRHIVVTGGEPTLVGQGFFSMMLAIKERFSNVNCLLLTNGRSFAIPKVVELSKETFPKGTLIAIPLYSAIQEEHDYITQMHWSFAQTCRGIHNVIKRGFSVEIRVVVSKLNYRGMTELAEFIVNEFRNVSVVNFMATEMCGNASVNRDRVWIDYNTAFQSCVKAIDILISNGVDVGLYNFPFCSVSKNYRGLYKKSISRYKVRYSEICEQCKMIELCGGVFQSSLSLAKQDFKPFYEEV